MSNTTNTITNERMEELLLNALEWAIEKDEETTTELIQHMGITSDELEAIGYERENFEIMHDAAN